MGVGVTPALFSLVRWAGRFCLVFLELQDVAVNRRALWIGLAVLMVLVGSGWYRLLIGNDPDRRTDGSSTYQVGETSDSSSVGEGVGSPATTLNSAISTSTLPAVGEGASRFSDLVAPEDYASQSRYGPLPRSLAGTVPVRVPFDANGHLVVSSEVTQLFEYFLAGLQDEGLETALARIREYLGMSLPPAAAAEALALLDPYLEYKRQLEGITPPMVTEANREQILQDLKVAMDERTALRQQLFTPAVAEGLFGVEAAYDRYAWEAVQVLHDETLGPEQRSSRLHTLEEQLPSSLRERVRDRRLKREAREYIDALRQQGASPEELHEARSAYFGEKVADRLSFIEDRSPAWNERVADYQSQVKALEDSRTLTAAELHQRKLVLRQSLFSSEEQMKLALHELQSARPAE